MDQNAHLLSKECAQVNNIFFSNVISKSINVIVNKLFLRTLGWSWVHYLRWEQQVEIWLILIDKFCCPVRIFKINIFVSDVENITSLQCLTLPSASDRQYCVVTPTLPDISPSARRLIMQSKVERDSSVESTSDDCKKFIWSYHWRFQTRCRRSVSRQHGRRKLCKRR